MALLFQPLIDYEVREVFESASIAVGVREQVSKYEFNKLIQVIDIAVLACSLRMATVSLATG